MSGSTSQEYVLLAFVVLGGIALDIFLSLVVARYAKSRGRSSRSWFWNAIVIGELWALLLSWLLRKRDQTKTQGDFWDWSDR